MRDYCIININENYVKTGFIELGKSYQCKPILHELFMGETLDFFYYRVGLIAIFHVISQKKNIIMYIGRG